MNLFLTLSVPQRNLAGWQKYRCFDEVAGKFIIDRGFACELLTCSSISTLELAVEALKTEDD